MTSFCNFLLYLHQVDSDEVLICEVHYVTHKSVDVLLYENLSTPLGVPILYMIVSIKEDQHNNIIDIKGTKHTVTLNTKVTKSHNLACVKDKLTECKKHLAVHDRQHHRSNQGRKSFGTNE